MREWRALDFAATQVIVRSRAVRVRCRAHGVVVAAVPWARHGARHTLGFEDLTAWAATELSASAIAQLLRIGWRTVGRSCSGWWPTTARPTTACRGSSGSASTRFPFAGASATSWPSWITARAAGVGPQGRDAATVDAFFAELGAERTAALTHVSADMGSWLHRSLKRRLGPETLVCIDPFHVVQLAGQALDEVRRETWNQARRRGPPPTPGELRAPASRSGSGPSG